MSYLTVYNTTDRPIIVDDEGRSVAGGTWAPVLSTTDQVRSAMDAGHLVKVANPAKGADVSPDAAEAFEATEALETARKKGPDELANAATSAGATKTRAAARAADAEEQS